MSSNMSGFQEFCGGDAIFDVELLINNTWPEFTSCFQNFVLVWTSCAYLWIILPLYAMYLRYYTANFVIPPSKLFYSKMFFTVSLVGLSIAGAIIAEPDPQSFPDRVADIVYWNGGIEAATYLLALLLIQYERVKGVISSGVLWSFWFLTLCVNIIPLYTKLYLQEYEDHFIPTVIFLAYFTVLFVMTILSSFGDPIHRDKYPDLGGDNMSNELLASFPSKVTFWWINGIIFTAAKRPLEETDIQELHPRDRGDRVVPEFADAWAEEVEVAKQKREVEKTSEPPVSNFSSFRPPTPGEDADEKTSLLAETESTSQKMPFKTPLQREKKLIPASLGKVLCKVYGLDLLKAHICKLVYDLLQFVSPILLGLLIDYTAEREAMKEAGQEWKGYVYACSFFVISTTISLLQHQNLYIGLALGMRIKSALIAAVYKKSLTVTQESKKETTVGEIVNLMSVDCQRMQDVTAFLWIIWSAPLTICIAMWMLWDLVGVSSLAGLAVMVILIPINFWVASFMRKIQIRQMRFVDERIKLLTEVLDGIKVLKLYAWEHHFREKIAAIRKEEVKILRTLAYLNAFTTFAWTNAPFVVTLATFACYVVVDPDHWLDPNTAFVALSLFNILRIPITQLPQLVSYAVQASVSVKRIGKFLRQDDLKTDNVRYDPTADYAVHVDRGTFTWDKELPTPTLQDITARIPEGKLVAVVGPVGSGKSSLMSAMLGELEKLGGEVTVKSSVAYVPQQAWIQNMTLRDNILFGSEYKHRAYTKVIDACSLKSDLDILAGGDMTEIGEKGINISGGQKQRVSLARAVYDDADIYILDDPLSAVDSHVGKHIFDKVISSKGLLKRKTRILVTHGVHWLPQVDHIIVMLDGKVSESGTYEDLLAYDGAFAQFLKQYLQQEDSEEEDLDPEIATIKADMRSKVDRVASDTGATSGDDVAALKRRMSRRVSMQFSRSFERKREERKAHEESLKHKPMEKLVQEETSETGKIALAVFMDYFKAIGIFSTIFFLFCFCVFQGASVYASLWLTDWTEDTILSNRSLVNTPPYKARNDYYLSVYGGLGVVQAIAVLVYAVVSCIQMVKAGALLHRSMLQNVLRCPMSFFDTTPSGRIVNRFSRDVETIDNLIPQQFRQWITNFFATIATLVVVSYSTPIFMAVIIPLGILYYLAQRFFIPTSRQLKRIESTTRSPIYTHFSETITGAACIRAYKVKERFILESETRVDKNLKHYFAWIASNRWLAVRLEGIGNLLILAAAMFAVLSEGVSESLVGLSVSYALQTTSALNWMVRAMTDLETSIVSVERVKEYIELANEAAWINPFRRPPPSWPQDGNVSFTDLMMRYRPGTELVLRGVTCEINGGEKIGIVGRTGAGKSSMTVSLFRLVEGAGGNIIIDGTNIADIGLHDLRSRLTILPQDPVLFSGSLRMNLDPINQYTDEAIWQALEHAHLKSFVLNSPGSLHYMCGEGGQNLSVGQRQLVCLARALLKKTKILVLDEATAAVDFETDELIQATIRSQFKDCTILTIAHRLNTIMDYDRIMVLAAGEIREFDTPASLLANTQSIFYSMARDANLV